MGSEPGPGQPVRLGSRMFTGTELAVVAIARRMPGSSLAAALAVVDRAVADGAALVDLDDAELIPPVRERHPDLVIVADRPLAGAALITTEPAPHSDTRPDGILATPDPDLGTGPELTGRIRELTAAGWPVLVTPPEADLPAALAATVVCAQHGARFVRTPHVLETRQALDMLATIRGDRPPAAARRGLA